MYLEFKDTVYDIHIWDRKGAMTRLTGDAILRYVGNAAMIGCRMESILKRL